MAAPAGTGSTAGSAPTRSTTATGTMSSSPLRTTARSTRSTAAPATTTSRGSAPTSTTTSSTASSSRRSSSAPRSLRSSPSAVRGPPNRRASPFLSFDPLEEVADDLDVPRRLFEIWHVCAVLEQQPLRAGEAIVQRLDERGRALVVAPRGEQRRHADLAEAPDHVPVLERARDRELV